MEPETERQQSANFFKTIKLLVDVGGDVLREALLKEIPETQLANEFYLNYRNFLILKKQKVLTDPQFSLVTNPSPDPSQFDVSLLVALLRNICPNVEEPAKGWKECPDETDKSLGAELVRIRDIRNKRLHPASTLMPKGSFSSLWTDLSSIIIRIATSISSEVTSRITEKIVYLKHEDTIPDGENEKKLFQTFIDWKNQIADILEEKMHLIEESLDSLHLKQDTVLDVVDAVREQGDASNERLHSFQEQLAQISQDVSSMSSQASGGKRARIEISSACLQQTDIEIMKQQLHQLLLDVSAIKQQLQVQGKTSKASGERPQVAEGYDPSKDLSDRDIDNIAKRLGLDWERLAIFLDYEEGQKDNLKYIYKDQPVSRNFQMIKRWSDVVKQCGESSRTLLAAAFANIDDNAMAQDLVPDKDVEEIKNLETSPATKERIKQIEFDSRRQGQALGNHPVIAVGGQDAVNIFDGEHTFGSLLISGSGDNSSRPLPDLSSLQSIPSDGNYQIGGPRSMNIYGGKVQTKDGEVIQIGPSGPVITSNQNVCRAEGFDSPDVVYQRVVPSNPSAPGSHKDSHMKKPFDNTMTDHTVNKVNEAMNSVGALIRVNEAVGTVFRVGDKYVMTAWHVVKSIVDPFKTGNPTWSNITRDQIRISFSYPNVQDTQVFSIQYISYFHADLDFCFLELCEPEKLPPSLKLLADEIPYTQAQCVHIIGYGSPNSPAKHLDSTCKILLPQDPSLKAAQAWLIQHKARLCQGLKSDVDPSKVSWGYSGYDSPDKLLFNCYLEHGASGAPLLSTGSLPDPVVVGILTNGLPYCFWDLTSTAQLMFPEHYRVEMGSRMSAIFKVLRIAMPHLVGNLFA